MKRKINLKLFVWILASVAVFFGVTFAIHWFQYQRIAGALLWQADRADKQGQTDRMIRYLQRYLEFAPRDINEKARLARALTSDFPGMSIRARINALYLLDSVVTADPSQSDLRRLLIKTALEVGRTKMARDQLALLWKENPDRLPPAERGELEFYWGQLAEAEKEPVNAVEHYRQAIQNRPTKLEAYARLVFLLRAKVETDPIKRQKTAVETDQLIDDMVAQNKESAQAYLARWAYRKQFDLIKIETSKDLDGNERKRLVVRGTSRDAGEDVTEALKRSPEAESVDALVAAAEMERLLRHRKEARDYLERGLKLQESKDFKGSIENLRPQLLWHTASILLDQLYDDKKLPADEHKSERAEIVNRIKQMRQFRNQAAAADCLEGRLCLLERRWAEGVSFLERARQTINRLGGNESLLTQVDMLLGQGYEQLEEPGQMYAAYRRVFDRDPDNATAYLGMGSAEWLQGRLDEALADYRKAIEKDKLSITNWNDITRLEIQRQLQNEPGRRDWREAEKFLNKAMQPDADGKPTTLIREHELTLLRVELLGAQENFTEAEKVLTTASKAVQGKDAQKEGELWALRSRLALRARKQQDALDVLVQAEKQLGPTIELRLARVFYCAIVGSRARQKQKSPAGSVGEVGNVPAGSVGEIRNVFGEVGNVLQQLEQLEQGIQDLKLADQGRMLDALTEAYFRMGNNVEGRRLCQQLALHPAHQGDVRLRLLLFDLALQAGDGPGMEKALAEVRQVERVQGPFSHYGQALRALWQAGKGKRNASEAISEAVRNLDRVAQLRPNWPPVYLARAQIAQIQGNTEMVIKELKQAVRLGDNSPAVIRRLVVALHEKQRFQEADETIQKLRSTLLVQSEMGRLAATTALCKGDPARALQLARDSMSAESQDFREQLWLSRILEAADKADEAKSTLNRAIELAPTELGPYVALVRFHASRKEHAQAMQVIEKAKAKVAVKHWPLCEAMCCDVLGLYKQAHEAYARAVQADPANVDTRQTCIGFLLRMGRLADAEKHLRLLVDPRGAFPVSPTERTLAKRALAMILADGTDFTRFQEALQLVGVKLDSNGYPDKQNIEGESPEGIRAQARVLATQSQRQFRERSLELFEQLARTQNLTIEDQFVQALLNNTASNWPRAREQMLGVALKSDPSPQTLAILARGLIQHNEFDEAQNWIKRLETMEKEREVTPNTFATVELRARLLEAKGQGNEALKVLDEHIKRKGAQPEEVLYLLGSLINQKRYTDAFDLLQRVWKDCRPEAAGAASVRLLRKMTPSDEQAQRVEGWLKEAIAKTPNKMVLRLQLADLLDVRGRYSEAIENLREIVKPENEPNNVVALNNLAWLLAHRKDGAEQAIDYINTAIKGLGKRAELLDTRGVVYLALGKTDQALTDLKEVNADASSPSRLFHLARAHNQARDRDNALKVLKQARNLGLQIEMLHPVEQKICQDLLADLHIK